MQYLLSEIVVFLILAWIVGLLTGWLIWRSSGSTETDETLKRKLADSQSMVRNLQRKVDTLQSEPTHHAAIPDRLADEADDSEEPADDDAPDAVEDDAPSPRLSSIPGGPTAAAFLDDLVADETEPPAPPAPAPLPDAPPMDEAPTYDDLQRITGIGPDFAQQLADLGVTTYRQIARFTDDDIERIGNHLDVFPDRVRREKWVQQAAVLHRETYGTHP